MKKKKSFSEFVRIIYELHLYESKGESLFKTFAFAISWGVGLYWQSLPVSYYLFSITIIMEFLFKLICQKKFLPKVLPFLFVISNLFVFILSTIEILGNSSKIHTIEFTIELIACILVSVDMALTLLIETPEDAKIESTVSRCGSKQNENVRI